MTIKCVYLLFSLTLMAGIGSAAEGDSPLLHSSLSTSDYFLIFIVGIVLLNLFVLGLRGIFRRKAPESKRSRFVVALGSLFALLFIAIGSLFFITAFLVILAAGAGMTVFLWLVDFLAFYTGPSISIGILTIGAAGLAFFLCGVYVLVAVHEPSKENRIGLPTRMGEPSKKEREDQVEALNPTITLKVSSRPDGKPVANARVILKQTNGTKFYTKTTNIEGEVTFDNIAGYSSDYYAFIDGDERREKFRIVHKKSSP